MAASRQDDTSKRFKTKVHRVPQLSGVAQNLMALQQDLEVARRIQARLLPACPQIGGYEFEAWCQSAAEVGGDFYDFLALRGGRIGIVAADASGKGLAGALLMVEARAIVRTMASVHSSPRDILIGTNRVLLRDLDRGMFVTIYFAVLDPAAGTLTVASAGHVPMLVSRRAARKCISISPAGLVCGAATEEMFDKGIREEVVALEPGDRFLLLTDGASELMNPVEQQFGMERLEELMRTHANASSANFLQVLVSQLEIHRAGHPQSDDITIVTGRRGT